MFWIAVACFEKCFRQKKVTYSEGLEFTITPLKIGRNNLNPENSSGDKSMVH